MRKYVLLIVAFVFHSFALSADNYTFCYWVDDNHVAAQTITRTTNTLDATVNVASLSPGMHTLFVRAKKNTGGWTVPKATHFFKVLNPTTVKTYYWFDDNEDNRFNVDKVNGETFAIDVSHLSDGTHTLHVRMEGEGATSATVSNQFLKISTNFDAYYWFDNETERRTFTNAGGSAMLIDVSHLKDGLHCFNAMLTNDVGSPSVPVSRTFIKMPSPTVNDSTTLTFWIDGVQHSQKKLAYGNEIVDLELNVDSLTTGMHFLQVQAVTNSGSASNIVSGYFMRMPGQDSDGVLAYRYWVNENNADLPFTAVDNPTIPYTLIGDLDVAPQPLRCARFHFEVNNDMPMLYAENDIHVQFMAADGHLIKTTNAYVESVAADTLTAEGWTEIQNDTVIYADKPTGETIYWYAMNLEAGDTVCLKTNYSSTLQVFSHSGNKVLESKADSSLIFRQFIAEKAEMYYIALHTVNTNKAQVILTVDLKEFIRYFNIETSAVGNGTVTEGGTYAEGTEITLTATPDEGYQFTQWSDGSTDNPRTLVLTQDTSLVAYFEIIYLQPDTVTLCYGETYQWHDKTYDASGVYIDTLSSGVATLHLTILPQVEETIEEATICSGDTYTWQADGKVYTESGIYSVTLQDINGCDSVVILHLTVNPIATTEEHITACDSYVWNGETYTQSGEYVYTTVAANGCDSIVTLHLTVNKTQYAEETATACDSYEWNGDTYTESGEYTYTTTAANGCDSIVTLHLTINQTQYAEESVFACDSYVWNRETYTESGDYVYTTVAANGCDSIVTLHLTINHSEIGEKEYATICYGETYTWNGQTYATSGEYSVTLSNTAGCDSVATLLLTIMPEAVTTTETVVIGSNELPYTWHGNTYSATGRYTVVEQYTTVACDSAIYVLDLTVLTTGNYDEQSVTICDSEAPYLWYGESYSATGKYTYTEKYVGTDIDSIQHILNLTINPTVYTEETMVACDSYEWNGQTYTQSGDYTYTTVAANGCDSIVTLHLTINQTQYAEETITVCDSYVWNGETYTESGDYTYTTVAANGCDSIVTLHLTVNKTQYAEETVVACDNYEWNGETYTESGEYTYTTTAANGCDSIVTLHLTINKTQYAEETIVACDSYEWNGQTYTQSGKYTYTTVAANGCDSIVTLHLTINKTQYVEETIVACDSYIWNGQTYTISGDYTYTTTAENGCDYIETLHLTINKSEKVKLSMVACDSYEWHGVTYTESGEYTYNTTTENGCERIETLYLTINKSKKMDLNMVACDSFEWHGVTYTESGDYIYTTTAENGCEQIETLHLTIHHSVHLEETVEVCDSYEWHGLTYSVSGEYTYTTTTENGCDYVETLHLIILPDATTESEKLALCPSELPYEWYGQILTEAGTYSATEQYAGMECDSVIHELTLDVYVQTLPATVTLPIVRIGEAIDVSVPTAEIQAHIAAETWYAPNAEVAWYIMDSNDWGTLTDKPVAAGIKEVILKYAVETDCGNVESDKMVITVETTDVENIHSQSPISNCQKILHEDHIYILRDGKIYSVMGQEL